MAQETETRHGLDAIAGVAREASRKGPPPVHLWNPPFCGDLDMRIASDGTWFYLKVPDWPAGAGKTVCFVLKREGGEYFLVTPVRNAARRRGRALPRRGAKVETATAVRRSGFALMSTTGSRVAPVMRCGSSLSLRPGGLKPYLHVRRQPLAESHAAPCFTTSSSSARSATSTGVRCSALRQRASSSLWRRPTA